MASIGGEGMEELAEAVEGLAGVFEAINAEVLAGIFAFALAIAISALAFWKGDEFLYILAAIVDWVYGLTFAATKTVYSAEWVEGLIVFFIGMYCLYYVVAKALRERKGKAK